MMKLALLAILSPLIHFCVAFQLLTPPTTNRLISPRARASTRLHLQNEDTLKAQRDDAKAALERLDALEKAILKEDASLTSLSKEVQEIESQVTRLTAELLPPRGLSMDDYQAAIRYYMRLPFRMRCALCEALEIPEAVKHLDRTPEIVSRLYEERITLTPQRLQDALKSVETRMENSVGKTRYVPSEEEVDIEKEAEEIVSLILDGKSPDEARKENYIQQHLGRVTRKEGKSATENDLDILMDVLDVSTFVPNGKPESFEGGYLIRGRNAKPNGKELIEALDSKLPSQWSAQVSLMPDFTENDNPGLSGEPILVLLNNDFSPTTSRWIQSFSTAAALATTLLFAVGCYGANENVAQHLTDLTSVGDYSGVNWFNGLLAQMVLPLLSIQAMHELGHGLVAWRDKIKVNPPTLLPFLALPFMSAQTQLKESPKNMTSLFDFALLGPFMGFVTSVIFLALGLQLTLTADAQTLQYFPSVPVSLLQLSTLGGSIVDAAYGGSGMVTMQSANVELHPFAIAGFCGVMINALEMLPLGSTDGGRISQALFGRSAHSVIGGIVWFSLLCTTLLLDNNEILLGAWVVNNIVQNDMEVPCREEVDQVDVVRIVGAFGMWFVAALALTPMNL